MLRNRNQAREPLVSHTRVIELQNAEPRERFQVRTQSEEIAVIGVRSVEPDDLDARGAVNRSHLRPAHKATQFHEWVARLVKLASCQADSYDTRDRVYERQGQHNNKKDRLATPRHHPKTLGTISTGLPCCELVSSLVILQTQDSAAFRPKSAGAGFRPVTSYVRQGRFSSRRFGSRTVTRRIAIPRNLRIRPILQQRRAKQ